MSGLININHRNFGGESIETVSARELHEFLEIGTVYAAWINERIEQYGFVEGKDYVVFSPEGKNPRGGRPLKEHAISLDMAKELAMVERNEKGKQARQYFIECERQAKERPAAKAPSALEPVKEFKALFGLAKLIGLDKNAAAISANQAVTHLTGTNLLSLLGQTHLEQPEQTQYFTPTELGERIKLSGRKVNMLLAEAGFQAKQGDTWEVMDAGRQFAKIYDTGKKHGSGVPIQQVKWSANVLPLLEQNKAA
jgi:phage anti-repressor protein